MTDILDRYLGCIIGGAVGDALGYPIEFMREDEIHSRFGEDGIATLAQAAELDWSDVAFFSDDTQMSLFTAAGLLAPAARAESAHESAIPSINHVWEAYHDWLFTQEMLGEADHESQHRRLWLAYLEPLQHRRAPGNTCISAIWGNVQGRPDLPINDSKGCGGVMRVAPVPLFCAACIDDNQVAEIVAADLSAQAAALTHSHTMGWIPAALLSRIISRSLVTVPSPDASQRFVQLDEIIASATKALAKDYEGAAHMDEFLQAVGVARKLAREAVTSAGRTFDLDAIHTLGGGWVGDEALHIALYASLAHVDDFGAAIRCAVNHNGDSDSTGAIAGNLLGALLGIDAVRNSFNLDDLEQVPLLEEIATELYAADDPSTPTSDNRPWGERYTKE